MCTSKSGGISPVWLLVVVFLMLAVVVFFAIDAHPTYATPILAAAAILNQIGTILVALFLQRGAGP
jgi:hypothetical protein